MEKILKKWYVFVIITLLIVVGILIVILNKKDTTETKETSNIEIEVKKKELTAENIVKEMKKKNENIGRILVFNEENDFNSLLGRPGQYTSKVTFEDVRIEQTNKDLDLEFFSELEREEPIGGTLEVFNNEKDMKKRKDYIDSFTSSMSMIAEYSYGKDRFLLRLDKKITPNQAEEYEKIFYEIIDNGIIELEESKEDEEELQGIIENFETTLESQEKKIYNSWIEGCIGNTVKGSTVKQMISNAISENTLNPDKNISIEYKGQKYKTKEEKRELQNKISAARIYTVESKSKDGFINDVIIKENNN